MPRIFDNLEQPLLNALQNTLQQAHRADFCVGYFNLRGWHPLGIHIHQWTGGEGQCCRLLIGMQRPPPDQLRELYSLRKSEETLDQRAVLQLKQQLAAEFRNQLAMGIPTATDEQTLQQLADQLETKKVIVKLFLRHSLHAKLYLLFRHDADNPITGYLGSSNLTLAGLVKQGELNVDVLEHDACHKLTRWFEDRWQDKWCVDISKELTEIIRQSWARTDLIPPYQIYVKMAYHLSAEARAGLSEFQIPKEFRSILFDFQAAAVKIAAHHLNRRGGVLIGDVVGLGKTLMAAAMLRIFRDDYGWRALVLCPKNLVTMWEDYEEHYDLGAKVLSLSQVHQLSDLRRYQVVVIDESHHLRNREGKRYRAIAEYIADNESKVILLSATPYNKTYLDLSSQLRLFIAENLQLGIRPEALLREYPGGVNAFPSRYQCSPHSLAAFEKSEHADDWRELMRWYMVRRTRSFIQKHYAKTDETTGRQYLPLVDGRKSYFPTRRPQTVKFQIDANNPLDQYARLYAETVVTTINDLHLPRYGLGNYLLPQPAKSPSPEEMKLIQNLSRAGKRLMGFCRTNLFKRLESSGYAFLLSIERHLLRNYVYLYAITQGQPLPIGTQDAVWLDTRWSDQDAEEIGWSEEEEEDDGESVEVIDTLSAVAKTAQIFQTRAKAIYQSYQTSGSKRFKWLSPQLFQPQLAADLRQDTEALLRLRQTCGEWQPAQDTKLQELKRLLVDRHPQEKVLIFTQFADTAHYLEQQLATQIPALMAVTGRVKNPTELAWRFSPVSNHKPIDATKELRVLIATDVLSEGQNLQDCANIVNYDLPWAIIRLIQRVGRVDRIGQATSVIHCYSFLPAEGIEQIIHLRARVRERLAQNAEVVGTDEAFFEDDRRDHVVVDLYHEKAGILDEEEDNDIDLASLAYQIWQTAIQQHPQLAQQIPQLPPVSYTTKASVTSTTGVLVYVRTTAGNDALAWLDENGQPVTESQLAILKAAECLPTTPALPRRPDHHTLVAKGVELILQEEQQLGGQLGSKNSIRRRTYERLKKYADAKGTVFKPDLPKAIDQLYRYPLRQAALDSLNRQLRSGIKDEDLAELVSTWYRDERLCLIEEQEVAQEPQIVCSLGLVAR